MRLLSYVALSGMVFLAGCVSMIAPDQPRGSGVRRPIAGSPDEIKQALRKLVAPGFTLTETADSVRMAYDKVVEGDRLRMALIYALSPGPSAEQTDVEAILESTSPQDVVRKAESDMLDELSSTVERVKKDEEARRQPPKFNLAVAVAPLEDRTPATYKEDDGYGDTDVPSFTRDPGKQAIYGADAMAAFMARDLSDSGLFASATPAGADAAELLIKPAYVRADEAGFSMEVQVLEGATPVLTRTYECKGSCATAHSILTVLDSLRSDLSGALSSR